MKSKKDIFYICLVVVFAIALVFGFFELPKFLNTVELSAFKVFGNEDQPAVTAQDQAPLPIPESARAKGRVLQLPVLMYHHVGVLPKDADAIRRGLTVSSSDFTQEVAWVKSQGYTSATFDDLWQFANAGKPLPKKPIIFSFDDGYDDVFTNAIPILKKYDYTGTFGIITNNPGTKQGTNSYASWNEIWSAKSQGQEIVCHTQNHFDGTNKKFTADYIYKNLSGCQKDLIAHVGSAEPYLIYPYGHYNNTYIEQAKKARFVMAFTVHEGKEINLDDLFEIPRVRVEGGESLKLFETKLK